MYNKQIAFTLSAFQEHRLVKNKDSKSESYHKNLFYRNTFSSFVSLERVGTKNCSNNYSYLVCKLTAFHFRQVDLLFEKVW